MIRFRETITYISAKVNKGFAWCIFIGLCLPLPAMTQTAHLAKYNAHTQEIVFHTTQDTTTSILFDKSFFAQLNHEKRKKNKTMYYRLAKYENPIAIQEVPVVIANSNIQVHIQGTLQGDTSAQFSFIVHESYNGWELEIKVPKISVNQVSFSLGLPQSYTITNLAPETIMMQKRRKEKLYLTLYGYTYRVGIYPNKKSP